MKKRKLNIQHSGEFLKEGKITTIRSLSDTSSIKEGEFAIVKETAYESDSLLVVYRAIQQGASAIIIERGARTDHGLIAAQELNVPVFVSEDFVKREDLKSLFQRLQGDFAVFQKQRGRRRSDKGGGAQPRKKEPPGRINTPHRVKINLGFPETIARFPELSELTDGIAFARLEFALLDILNNVHPLKALRVQGEKQLALKLAEALEPVVAAFGQKPVWFRTDDFSPEQLIQMDGGQKFEKKEMSSNMGWRGIRRSVDQPRMVKYQFMAIKELIKKGYSNIGLFPPMVMEHEEYKKWLEIASECGLAKENLSFGLMIETPSCALTIEDFLDDIEFGIFGTNDLTQFTLAADRNNPKLVGRFSERKPAVVTLMRQVIQKCRQNGIETSVGGQAGSDIGLIGDLLDSGLSGTSVNPDAQTIFLMRKFFLAQGS